MHKHLSLTDFYATLSCMDYQTPFPSDIGTMDLAKRCAKTVGIEWESSGVGKCIEGKTGKREGLAREGYELLWDSVDRTFKENVTKSCTIRIDSKIVKGGKRVCQVDGGVWTGCDVSTGLSRLWGRLKSLTRRMVMLHQTSRESSNKNGKRCSSALLRCIPACIIYA
jgi:hypothetical protein